MAMDTAGVLCLLELTHLAWMDCSTTTARKASLRRR